VTGKTVLLRQVHPQFMPGGQLSSQAFLPFPKDKGKLSVYDGGAISAAEAFAHYSAYLKNASAGIWGVDCAEVTTIGLTPVSDPLEGFASHALIDFTAHPEKSFRRLAKQLKACALARGCLYSP
jgi:hypothetical protein